MGAKAVTNVVQGKPVFDGVIAAGIGGAVEGAVFASTFKPRLASMAGSAAESAANEAGDYLSGKKGTHLGKCGGISPEYRKGCSG